MTEQIEIFWTILWLERVLDQFGENGQWGASLPPTSLS